MNNITDITLPTDKIASAPDNTNGITVASTPLESRSVLVGNKSITDALDDRAASTNAMNHSSDEHSLLVKNASMQHKSDKAFFAN